MANALQAALPNRVSDGCLPIFLYLFLARARNKRTNTHLQFDSVNDESEPELRPKARRPGTSQGPPKYHVSSSGGYSQKRDEICPAF